MSQRTLEPLVIPAGDPSSILGDLEEAIAGQRTLLPLPGNDRQRADLLRGSQGVGRDIDPDVALVLATSGSTGTPKGALLTAANLVSSADATHQLLGRQGHWLLALPAYHVAGMQVLIRSLVAGVAPAVLDLRGGFDTRAFARQAQRLGATGDATYTSLSPNQLAKAMETRHGIEALRQFDAVLVGGSVIPLETHRSALALGIKVVSTYGSSETSGGCVYDGRPIPGARVRVGKGGRIFLGGPMVAAGYRNAPDHEAFAEPGWFATSDAGRLDEGRLTVQGRMDSVIDTGGLKLHPEVLERAIVAVAGVSEACVVGVPHPRFGQAVVAAYAGSALPAEVMEALADLPRWQLPKQLRRVQALPRMGIGKVDRQAVTELFTPEH